MEQKQRVIVYIDGFKILRLATPKKVAYFLYIQLEYGAKTTRYSLY